MDTIPITKKLIAFGSKKIYFPRFTIALVRTEKLSPYHARFLVPLDFSKYDLRDYLYHAYNVRCFNIRSYVKQMPVRDTRVQPRHWFREDSKKYMTVEMEQPFVWPEIPDLRPWGQEERRKEVEELLSSRTSNGHKEQRQAATSLRKTVAELFRKGNMVLPGKRVVKQTREGKTVENDRKGKETRASPKFASPVKIWEESRTRKVVESDDPERTKYKTKV